VVMFCTVAFLKMLFLKHEIDLNQVITFV